MSRVTTYNLPISIHYPLSLRLKLNLRLFWIFSIFFALSLLVFYMFQINSIVHNTYAIRDYEKRVAEFSEENTKLQIQLSELNSLENLENLVASLNYEKIDQVRYIQIVGSQVVTK